MGRRVKKTVYVYESSAFNLQSTYLYVYDGWNLIEELDADENIQKSYVWGLDMSQTLQGAGGVGGLLAAVDDGVTYLYSYDGNGNVGQVIDAVDGSVDAHYEYEPYGNLLNLDGAYAEENGYRFSTKYFDQETGLFYYGYRYYSPDIGRWMNRDPLGIKGSSVKSMSSGSELSAGLDFNIIALYVFIDNNSISNIDHLGLYTIEEASLKEFKENNTNYSSTDSWKKKFVQWYEKRSYQERFDFWYKWEKTNGQWWTSLPRCPKSLCLVYSKNGATGQYRGAALNPDTSKWKDPQCPSYAELALHPRTAWSMRSKPDGNGHTNQCTYNEHGYLLTTPPGAGTVDWHESGTMTHYHHDVEPIYLAQYLDGGGKMSLKPWSPSILSKAGPNMIKYYEVRPLHAEE